MKVGTRLQVPRFWLALVLSFTITLSASLTWFVIRSPGLAPLFPTKNVSSQSLEKFDSPTIAGELAPRWPPAPAEPLVTAPRLWQSQRRAPTCQDLTARIVSQNENPYLSLATVSLKGDKPRLVRLGSKLGENQVVGIGYDRGRMSPNVVLSNERGLCQAMLFERPVPTTNALPARTKAKSTRAPTTEILIERSAVDSIFERVFELTRGIRVVPDHKNGVASGMRVFGVGPDSLLAALGIENGDTIKRVNGASIATPEGALSAYTNLRSAPRFDVEVDRAGTPVHIEIRVN